MNEYQLFQLFVANYLLVLNPACPFRMRIIEDALKISSTSGPPIKAAYDYVAWRLGLGGKPSWLP